MMNSLGKDLLLISLLFSLTALSAESSFDRCENPQTIALIERAKAVIDMIMYQNLATVDEDGEAWIAPVYSAFDDKYNFYWKSSLTCQHSKNIRFKSNTFTSIYDSTVEEDDTHQGRRPLQLKTGPRWCWRTSRPRRF